MTDIKFPLGEELLDFRNWADLHVRARMMVNYVYLCCLTKTTTYLVSDRGIAGLSNTGSL